LGTLVKIKRKKDRLPRRKANWGCESERGVANGENIEALPKSWEIPCEKIDDIKSKKEGCGEV